MSIYDDPLFGKLLPVRDGPAQGSAAERVMLDTLGGSESFKTRIQNNPDGSSTILRTKNGSPQFQTSKVADAVVAVCKFGMDSGIVDLRNTSYQDKPAIPVNIYDPGFLYESTYVQNYTSGFVPKTYPFRLNPAATNQFAGDLSITASSEKGRVPVDALSSRAFAPKVVSNTLDPKDDVLAQKKFAARWCPPSVFTGRCRLYIQALFGRYTYNGNSHFLDGALACDGSANPIPVLATISPPALRIQGKGGGVTVDTSSGVYLDPLTAEHWLFAVTTGYVRCYKLVSDACGEKLRAKLLDGRSLEDKEHIEAYILSRSRPDTGSVQTLVIDGSFSPLSCGYGWHWKWSSAVANIVVNERFQQDASHTGMRSTHYQLSLTHLSASWSAQVIKLEGPVDWAVNRQALCIAAPLWGQNCLQKITPRYTTPITCNAPFYAFYTRDDLKVCRVVQDIAPAANPPADETPSYLNGRYSIGMLDGRYNTSHTDPLYSLAVHVNESVVADTTVGGSHYETRSEVINKRESGDAPSEVFAYLRTPSFSLNIDYPLNHGTFPDSEWNTVTFDNPGWESGQLLEVWEAVFQCYAETNDEQFTESRYGMVAVAIPVNDAESMYAYGESEVTHNQVYKNVATYRTGGFMSARFVKYYSSASVVSGRSAFFKYYEGFQIDALGESSIVSQSSLGAATTTSYSGGIGVLICRAGSVGATFHRSVLNSFHDDTQDVVDATFDTHSGSRIDTPVVLADGFITSIGAGSGGLATLPALVGWV